MPHIGLALRNTPHRAARRHLRSKGIDIAITEGDPHLQPLTPERGPSTDHWFAPSPDSNADVRADLDIGFRVMDSAPARPRDAEGSLLVTTPCGCSFRRGSASHWGEATPTHSLPRRHRRTLAEREVGWEPSPVRVLCATTANDGHFGPVLPFARAFAEAGHEVRVAAPASYAGRVAEAGFGHEPFADPPRELIGPVMARLPAMAFEAADDLVIREVFARIDAQAALPSLKETVRRWRPDLMLRESAELASLAAAEHAEVPHVHVCIGMHEILPRFAQAISDPLEELGRLAGLVEGRMTSALASETVLSLVPEILDRARGQVPSGSNGLLRFHEPRPPSSSSAQRLPDWGDSRLPLIYVTFGSVTGSLPPFAGVFRDALDALADVEARVLLTVGRKVDPSGLGPVPSNAHVEQWLPQDAVLGRAAAMLGHGGFGTTMGALAAGVPQVVVPLFTFDQVVNGDHVAAVGAGRAVERGPSSVGSAAAEIPELLADPTYAASARRVAAAMAELPSTAEAVRTLVGMVG